MKNLLINMGYKFIDDDMMGHVYRKTVHGHTITAKIGGSGEYIGEVDFYAVVKCGAGTASICVSGVGSVSEAEYFITRHEAVGVYRVRN